MEDEAIILLAGVKSISPFRALEIVIPVLCNDDLVLKTVYFCIIAALL